MNVKVKDLDDMTVACIRHVGPFQGDSDLFEGLFKKLCSWAGPKKLLGPDTVFMSAYYDDPEKVKPEEMKIDVGMTVSDDVEIDDKEIEKREFKGGKFVVATVEVKDSKDYMTAWNELYREWIPEKGYEILEEPCFEIYRSDPKEDPEGKHIVDLCVPIK
jgi:AraC family transcriptional regulator